MKIGIFSGTFDPVHSGHLWLAQKALDIGLDKVVFTPEAIPWRKKNITTLDKRREMLELVIKDSDKLEVLVLGEDSQHTVDGVLDGLKEQFTDQDQFTLIMGGDVFEHLPKWEGIERLVNEVNFIVALRTEDDGELVVQIAQELAISPEIIVSEYIGLSSSAVRDKISAGREVQGVPLSVFEYIKSSGLYE